jgi:ribonucleoside-diphosphate reductase alpha chain
MIDIGFLPPKGRAGERMIEGRVVALDTGLDPGLDSDRASGSGTGAALPFAGSRLRQCPKCGEAALIQLEGCDQCTSCAYSKCG